MVAGVSLFCGHPRPFPYFPPASILPVPPQTLQLMEELPVPLHASHRMPARAPLPSHTAQVPEIRPVPLHVAQFFSTVMGVFTLPPHPEGWRHPIPTTVDTPNTTTTRTIAERMSNPPL